MLKIFRKNANMTQEDIAYELNVTQGTVSKLEKGNKPIDIQTFMQWVRVTNSEIHAAAMMFGTDVISTAMTMVQAIPMFIGGFNLWI